MMIDFDRLAKAFERGPAIHKHTLGCFDDGSEGCPRCQQEAEVRAVFLRHYRDVKRASEPGWEDEQRRIFAEMLRSSLEVHPRLAAMGDKKIAELLRDGVWSQSKLFSPIADLLEAAIDRLNRANGGPMPLEGAFEPEREIRA